jgi:FkbM family methyltransferase
MNHEHLKLQDEFVYTEIFDWNVYQVKPEEIFNANILDLGGHFGMFDIYCNNLKAKKIITVEANPYNFVKLLQNTRDIENLKAINTAVTTSTGSFITINNEGCQSQLNKGDIKISTVSFVDVVDWFNKDEDIVLKIDIEGAEYDIFLNTPSYIFKRFKYIYAEFHEENIAGKGKNIKMLDAYVQSLGFNSLWEGRFYTNTQDGKKPNNDIAVFKYERIS